MIRAMNAACCAAAMLLMAIACTGCSTGPSVNVDPFDVAPADFFIDVTVLASPPLSAVADAPAPPVEPHLRPSRYVLFADGTLRYGDDPQGRGVRWLPPIARILTRQQTAQVWSAASQLGLTDPAMGDPIVNFKLIEAQPGERVYLADFSGGGQRWNFVRRTSIDQPPDAALSLLVDELAKLAWASDAIVEEARTAPRRYDFGPDPYARYRHRESEE